MKPIKVSSTRYKIIQLVCLEVVLLALMLIIVIGYSLYQTI